MPRGTKNTKRRYSAEQRQSHADAFRASGASQEGYCGTAGISPNSLTKWMKEFPAKRAPKVEENARASYNKRSDSDAVSVPREKVKEMIQLLTGLL